MAQSIINSGAKKVIYSAQDNGLGVVLGGGRIYDLLGATVNDGLGHLFGKEHTSGLTT